MAVLGVPKGSVGVIGGTEVFALFLDKYDIFYLSQVPAVRLPGGQTGISRSARENSRRSADAPRAKTGQQQLLGAEKAVALVERYRP